jgi:hypothetical protein
METEGVVFVKNNTCVADLGGDNGLWVNVDLKFGGIVKIWICIAIKIWTVWKLRIKVLTKDIHLVFTVSANHVWTIMHKLMA